MRLAFQIAWRFLMSAKKQTLLIILGIAVGVSVQVFIGALITGLQDSLVDQTIGSSSHVTVSTSDEYILDYTSDISEIKSLNKDLTSISPVLDTGGFMTFKDIKKRYILED